MTTTALVLSTWLALACGADVNAPPAHPVLERVDFAADHPETWPKTNPPLVAMPRDEFEQLWSAIQPKPQTRPIAVLERAVYRASIVNHRLQGGTLTAEVCKTGPRSGWLRWTPFNLALSEVRWQDGPAVFGADLNGQHWLLADRARGEFTALWTLLGRRLGQQTEFALEVPSALSSTVVLRAPRGLRLFCTDSAIPVEAGAPEGTWVMWRIDLGSRSRATIVVRREQDVAVPSVLTYRNQVTADVSEDYLRFQVLVSAEVLDAPTQELDFTLPKTVELYSVTYGAETPLSWTNVGGNGSRTRLRVRLPDAIRGELRPIRFEGIWPRRPNEPTIIPQLELIDGVFLGAMQTVTLLRPLELSAITMTGCREAAAVTPGVEGDSYQFQQFLPEALLKLEVRRPTSQLAAQVLSAVTFDAEEWKQRTDIAWSTLSGTAFQVFARIPRGWEVTHVDAVTTSGAPDRINWDIAEDSEGNTKLNVEFLEAVTPASPRIVRILTRQHRAMETRILVFPAPRPLDVASGECVLVLQGEGAYRVGLPRDPAISTVAPTALSDAWKTLPLWSVLSREDERHPAVWCRTDGNDVGSPIALEREPSPAAISTHVSAIVGLQDIRETYDLTIRPEGKPPLDRVLAYVNESGGDLAWKVIAPAGLSLVATRLQSEQHALWRLPLSGELWEVRLPERSTTEWQLQAERVRGVTLPVRVGLMTIPQSTVAGSTVAVREVDNVVLDWTARGLQEAAHAVEDLPQLRRWQALQSAAELIGDANVSRTQSSQFLCEGRLKSTLVMAPGEGDLHELRLTVRGLSRPFSLTLPKDAEWLTATINGVAIAPEADRQLRVPANTVGDKSVIEWVYRTSGSVPITGSRRIIPWPTGFQNPVWTRFEWDIQTPPGVQADASASGLRTSEPAPAVTWRRRLFGPLARAEQSPLFLPWKADSWTALDRPDTSAITAAATEANSVGPTGWLRQRYYGPTPPDQFVVDVVDLNRTRSLAWLALLSSAIGVLGARASGWVLRDRLAALLLSVGLAVSFWCDGAWSDIIGGAMAGVTIGGLLPRRWWQPPAAVVQAAEAVPGGSTQSFVISQPISLLLCFALGLGACWAADNPLGLRDAVATIYVPIDADGRPSQRLPFVYLAPDLQKRLLALQTQQAADTPTMLIERADYRVAIGAEPRTGFSVTYRILSPSGPATSCDLLLPLVTLSGPQSCLIDGRPGAVSSLPGKRGLRVMIPASSAPVSAIGEVQYEPHEIMLDFDHPWRRNGTGGTCELPLPRTAMTRAEVAGLSPTCEVQLDGILGGWERSLDSRQLTISLGAVDRFRLQWHERAAADSKPLQVLKATTTESLKVTAAALEVRCRSTVVPQTDSVTRLAWDFPAETHFRSLQVRPSGRAEVTTLSNKLVRVEVDFYEPVHDQAVLEAELIVRHAPHLGEFVWRGVTPVELSGTQYDHPQRLWALSSVSELRVQPQSVENSGLVPVAAESVRDLIAGLTADRSPQALYQVGTENPIAFRWTTVSPRRRLLLWQQRGEVVGSRLRWTLEADLEATTQPPAYSHSFLIDRRLQIDQITVRERGAERLLRYTESRPSGSPHVRVTLWLTDPCLETQRIVLTAHMPLSTSAVTTLPNVRCEDADLVGGRYELQSTRELRGIWQPGRGLRPLSMPDDRLDVAQHWIFEQTDVEPRATVRFQPQKLPGAGRALYAVSNAENGHVQMQTRWEMPASDMLAGMQIMVPRPWAFEQPPVAQGLEIATTETSERGLLLTLGAIRRPVPVVLELTLRAPRSEFVQRELPLPTLSHDPGFVTWIAEATHTESAAMLAGLSTSSRMDAPEWVGQWLETWTEPGSGDWRVVPSLELPSHWPRSEASAVDVTRRFEWEEHRLWCWDDNRISGATRVWLEVPAASLTVAIPDAVRFLGADLDDSAAVVGTTSSGVWGITSLSGSVFRRATLYWEATSTTASSWTPTFGTAVPTVQGRSKIPPTVTVFPSASRRFLSNMGMSDNDWVDRALLRLEVLGDHLTFHPDDPDAHQVAVQFRDLYEVTAEKLGRTMNVLTQSGNARRERWEATVTRMNQAAKLLTGGKTSSETAIDDLLVDHPDAGYQLSVSEGSTSTARMVPAWSGRLLSAVAAVLFGFSLLRRIIRREWSPWFVAHPYAAVGFLGAVWWLCLSPSIAGLALVCLAIALGWNARRDRSAPAVG